jgi:hypothetical protein
VNLVHVAYISCFLFLHACSPRRARPRGTRGISELALIMPSLRKSVSRSMRKMVGNESPLPPPPFSVVSSPSFQEAIKERTSVVLPISPSAQPAPPLPTAAFSFDPSRIQSSAAAPSTEMELGELEAYWRKLEEGDDDDDELDGTTQQTTDASVAELRQAATWVGKTSKTRAVPLTGGVTLISPSPSPAKSGSGGGGSRTRRVFDTDGSPAPCEAGLLSSVPVAPKAANLPPPPIPDTESSMSMASARAPSQAADEMRLPSVPKSPPALFPSVPGDAPTLSLPDVPGSSAPDVPAEPTLSLPDAPTAVPATLPDAPTTLADPQPKDRPSQTTSHGRRPAAAPSSRGSDRGGGLGRMWWVALALALAAVVAGVQLGITGHSSARIELETSGRVGSVAVVGSWDGFAASRPLARTGWPSAPAPAPPHTVLWARRVLLPCGESRYHFLVDGKPRYEKAGLWRRLLLRRPKRYVVMAC